ncbi:MAG: PQQ-like beta-propeller repeat protein [Deltaproteobacteria bacterium]|nr:PQQ-like beta-propeller repeat protein [Deltaproteobacteria bacterium]
MTLRRLSVAIVAAILLAGCATAPGWRLRAPVVATPWSIAFGGSASEPVVSDGWLYVGSADGFVSASDARTGVLRWRFAANAAVNVTPLVHGRSIFVGSDGGDFFALDAASGNLHWSIDAGRPVSSAALVVAGRVYFVANELRRIPGSRPIARGTLFALDAESGAEHWSWGGDELLSPPLRVGDLLIVVAREVVAGSSHWSLHALDSDSGEPRWSRELRGRQPGPLLLADGRLFVVAKAASAGRDNGPFIPSLYAFDPASGTQLWQHRGAPHQSGIRAAVLGKTALVGTNRGIQALDAASGARLWSWDPEGQVSSESLQAAGLVVVPAQAAEKVEARATHSHAHLESRTHALDPATGELRWSAQAGDNPVVRGIIDEIVYVQSDDRMTALDLATGRRLWSFTTGKVELHFAQFSAGPVAFDGMVCFVTRTNAPYQQPVIPGRLFCVDVETGTLPSE